MSQFNLPNRGAAKCEDCDQIPKYLMYVGLFGISFMVLAIILQGVMYVFYSNNKKKIQRVGTIVKEILIFFNNLLTLVQDGDDVINDANKILNKAVILGGNIEGLINAILTDA